VIYVIATTKLKPGQRDAYLAGHKRVITETCKEKGCVSYEGHTSVRDPDVYVVVERWETRDDLDAHGRAPHIGAWREYAAPMKASPTVIEIISDARVDTVQG
jgi:quinol monooxygenase YgiN